MEMMLALTVLPPGVDSPAQFFVVGALAALIMGAAKGGFAGSVGLLSVPMMVHACGGDSAFALGMMLPLLVVCDYVALPFWRGQWDWRNVKLLLPGMLAGIAGGSGVLWLFLEMGRAEGSMKRPNAALALTIGLIALGFVTLQALRALRGELKLFRPNRLHGFVAGAAAGATSTLSHSAGPITTMFLLPQQMPKGRYVATTVLYYWLGNQAKLLPYLLLGQLNTRSLAAAGVLAPAIAAGALLGIFLHHRVNQRIFNLIVYTLLAVIAIHLTVTSIPKLLS